MLEFGLQERRHSHSDSLKTLGIGRELAVGHFAGRGMSGLRLTDLRHLQSGRERKQKIEHHLA
jgi:hypothetical protein